MIYIDWKHQDMGGIIIKEQQSWVFGEESIIGHLLFQRLLLILSKRLLHILRERRVGEIFDFIRVSKNVRNIHDIFYIEIKCGSFLVNRKIL